MFISLLAFSFACSRVPVSELNNDMESEIESGLEFGDVTVLGSKLNNPYSLSNMQEAYNALLGVKSASCEEGTLEPNWLYVRFLPKDTADINILKRFDLILFDYPLDYEIKVYGEYYHDPDIPDDEFTWQYTRVRPDFEFPDMTYEILDKCYIPEEDDELTKSELFSSSDLERAAIINAGLPEQYSRFNETKGLFFGKRPYGTLTMTNDYTGKNEYLKGVKVICHYFLNIDSAYTNEYGTYSMNNKFLCDPQYSIDFINRKDFEIWQNRGCSFCANIELGYHSREGFNYNVNTSDKGWKVAIINNAAYDYYTACQQEGVSTPPSDLIIWCWPDVSASSAAMLRHLKGFMIPSNLLLGLGNVFTPDVTIGMTRKDNSGNVTLSPNSNYAAHYCNVWHELTHASHFSKAGESYWAGLVNYGVFNMGYGEEQSNSKHEPLCGLAEALAYANERYTYDTKFYNPQKEGYNIQSKSGKNWWFEKNGYIKYFYYLLDYLSSTQKNRTARSLVFKCLNSNVKSIEDFHKQILKLFPAKKYPEEYEIINEIYSKNINK